MLICWDPGAESNLEISSQPTSPQAHQSSNLQSRAVSPELGCLFLFVLCLQGMTSILIHSRLLCPWDCLDKNTEVGCLPLLQGTFLTWGSNLCLLHCQQILFHLSHQGSPNLFQKQITDFKTMCYKQPVSMTS